MVNISIQSIALQSIYSLDAKIGDSEGEGRSFSEIIPDENLVNPSDEIDQQKVIMRIKGCLKNLSAREEKILRLRFGIADDLMSDKQFEEDTITI